MSPLYLNLGFRSRNFGHFPCFRVKIPAISLFLTFFWFFILAGALVERGRKNTFEVFFLSPTTPETNFCSGGDMQSNLNCFVDCTTPFVPCRLLEKGEIRNLNRLWYPWERESFEYFTLSDFWNCYHEWSVYGAGVPITLSTGDAVVQYYVPYLSAIQIFTSASLLNSFRDDSESGNCETRDPLSDSTSEESENDKLWRLDACSSEDGGGSEQEGISRHNDRLGFLYFQYFERITPYGRVPLMDKILSFAKKFPGLMSLRSVDLSPASWVAVAWYPIYHIPMGKTIKDLSACFLSYHTLSSSFQEEEMEGDMDPQKKGGEREVMAVTAFGLATYKMQGSLWVSGDDGRDQLRLASLLDVADSWLKQLKVQHHDFNYFMGIRP